MPKGWEISRYKHYTQAGTSAALNIIKLPQLSDEARALWSLFAQLPQINYTELKAFEDLTGEPLANWEITALLQLDRLRQNPGAWQPK